MEIRVLRIIEYIYADSNAATDDMDMWTHAYKTKTMKMRSTSLPLETVEWKEVDGS